MKPSSLIVAEGEEEEAENQAEEEEGEEGVVKDFKKGLCHNVERILKEFCGKHELKPLKIMVTGPTEDEL